MQVTTEPADDPFATAGRARRSACPIACSLDLLGDRWTLLVIRDLLRGKHRFGEFLASAEHIPTNILADRLKRLEASGLIASTPYSQHPRRKAYSLTPAGESLAPVLHAVRDWGLAHLPDTHLPDATRPPDARLPSPSSEL